MNNKDEWREAFEAWAKSEGAVCFIRHKGRYSEDSVNISFIGWKAAHEAQQEKIDKLLEALEEADEALDYVEEACLCERFKTKGFDYHEKHKYMGKCESGKRWLSPSNRIVGTRTIVKKALENHKAAKEK